VRDAKNGKQLLTFSGHGDSLYCNYFVSMAWSPDGTRLATGAVQDGTTWLWDAKTGKELFTLSGGTESVDKIAWSPDGGRLATASKGVVQVYALDIRELLTVAQERVTAHPSTINCQKYFHSECPSFPKLVWW
jgi:WD40 repeat protein